jgi:dienelactone hydrolase
MCRRLSVTGLLILTLACISTACAGDDDLSVRQKYLEQIRSWLPPETPGRGAVSPLDATWADWLKRTGELPPDFNKLPSMPFLPDPLILDEGGKNIPVKTAEQWQEKREWIAGQVKHWLSGTFPPEPNNLEAVVTSEAKDGAATIRMVKLQFGPDHKAKMTVELIIPPGAGPFPVFMTQWNHRGWALVAVRRGYIGCVYAGADGKDDTEDYAKIWYPRYDFTRLARRAWGASRAVDYLYTLPIVDKEKIALTGHSRNGKQSLIAAAFDERIKAVITSSGGTGAEVPWRYTSEPYDNETIADITTPNPNWFHPRLRFFVGREHKLPIDQNLLMALIAPRGLMLSSALTEHQGNGWGIEQCYYSLQRVYKFLGAEDRVAIRFRWGRHGTSARDIEDYIDFFDYCFGRSDRKPANTLYYNYTFEKWRQLSGETLDPSSYPQRDINDLLLKTNGGKIETAADWQVKRADIQKRIRWVLGDEPAGAINPGPKVAARIPHTDNEYSGDYLARVIGRPRTGGEVRRLVIGEYDGFGDYLEGNLYYPAALGDKPVAGAKLPVVIWLHEYAYPTGFARRSEEVIEGFIKQGFGVFLFDQIGFGTRIEEGANFYQRYPHWSKLGKMVADTKAAVDMLGNLDAVDANRIYAGGYSLGGTIALYTAALDERIKGVVCIGGLTPLRPATPDKETEEGLALSHLHGLLPRLGFFVGNEGRIPIDFDEILACISPRPALVMAPTWDQYAKPEDVRLCIIRSADIYKLCGAGDKVLLDNPQDYGRFSQENMKKTFDFCEKHFRLWAPTLNKPNL